MMKMLFAAAALLVASTIGLPDGARAEGLSGKALLEEVSKGGYVVYMRHTKTSKTEKDSDVSDLSNCATQRNLSDEGRAQAAAIAKGLESHGVTFERVLASPYCRAVETADIMFGRHEKADGLRYLTRLGPDEAATATEWLKKELGVVPAGGSNTILISHTANLKEGVGIWPKDAGDINVFKPNGDGTFTHIGTITAGEWAVLTS